MSAKVIFSINSYLKYQSYINEVDTEISGLGKVVKDKNDTFYIEDLILLPQTVTGVTTICHNGKFYDDLMASGGTPADYRLWWHSHVNMPVFWSTTDSNTIDDFDTELPDENWVLSIVGNKRGEILCRADLFEPFRLTMDKVPWEIDFTDPLITLQVKDDISKNIVSYLPPINPKLKDRFWLKPTEDYFPKRDIILEL